MNTDAFERACKAANDLHVRGQTNEALKALGRLLTVIASEEQRQMCLNEVKTLRMRLDQKS